MRGVPVGLAAKISAGALLLPLCIPAALAEEVQQQTRALRVNEAEFSVAGPEQLTVEQPARISLKIKNLSTKKTSFAMDGAIKPELSDAKGMPIAFTTTKKASGASPPMVIAPGEQTSLDFITTIDKDPEGLRLNLQDCYSIRFSALLRKPATVRLSFSYVSKGAATKNSPGGKIWLGEATTEDIELKLDDGSKPAPAGAPSDGAELTPLSPGTP